MSPAHDHPAALDPDRLAAECTTRRLRRSGPGGQNRNKVETAIVLIHRPSGLVAEASERRSQAENRRVALFRLRLNLALEVRRPIDPHSPPSPLWGARCRDRRIVVNPAHDDFPALLAEALDVLEAHRLDIKAAAASLACTPSQLIKLFRSEPRAFARINARRLGLGLHPIH